MNRNRNLASIPLIIVGIIFINIGLGGDQRRAFIGVGAVFIAVGIARLIRRKRPEADGGAVVPPPGPG